MEPKISSRARLQAIDVNDVLYQLSHATGYIIGLYQPHAALSSLFAGFRAKSPPRLGDGLHGDHFLRCTGVRRMVASGWAACFMNAEGLMPTMFLNCLEKW